MKPKNGFDQKRSSRIEIVCYRCHPIISSIDTPDLSEKESSCLLVLNYRGMLTRHPALPLGRVVERSTKDLILNGKSVDMDVDTFIKKLNDMTRTEGIVLLECAEANIAQLRRMEGKPDQMSTTKNGR